MSLDIKLVMISLIFLKLFEHLLITQRDVLKQDDKVTSVIQLPSKLSSESLI